MAKEDNPKPKPEPKPRPQKPSSEFIKEERDPKKRK